MTDSLAFLDNETTTDGVYMFNIIVAIQSCEDIRLRSRRVSQSSDILLPKAYLVLLFRLT